jgi:hypothetical protein
MPVAVGKASALNGITAALDHPEFATAIGLVKFGSYQQKKRAQGGLLARGFKNTFGAFFQRS